MVGLRNTPFQVEKYSRHTKHQDNKGGHYFDQHIEDLLEKFHGVGTKGDSLYINMQSVLNFRKGGLDFRADR